MPPAVRTAQVLLVLPPAAAAGLMAVGMARSGEGSACLLWFLVAVAVGAAVLAVGLGGRSDIYRLFAVAAGWGWVGLGGTAALAGVTLIGAYGLGCWVILFVGLPLLLCGYGLVTAARSDSAREWCRPGRRPTS